MMNPKPFQRRIAIVLLAIFLPSLMPVNLLYASNNGPNAFEAASFEPVDATDMVNLATGDLNYVLPLLNVPSPEGGYPLALSYKAGIAMDQEASWVGLGWSLNPGAINRNVNGHADDIEEGNEYTFIYDSGGQLNYYNVGIGANYKGITLGVGAYWGSNKTFGGSVTFGVGPAVGTIGGGSMGIQGGVGYTNDISNGVSLKSFRYQKGSGTGISNQGSGSFNSSSSYSQNDYDISVESTGFNSGFGIYYGHTKIKYSLFEDIMRIYSGILYPDFFASQGQNYKTYLSKSFDTDKLVMYKKGEEGILDINNFTKAHLYENNLLPNYDRYQLNAQGLSGQIKPAFTEELPSLMHLNSYKNDFWASSKIDGLAYFNYRRSIGNPDTFGDINMKLNNKIFFEFENSNSSFLRIDRTNITRDINSEVGTNQTDYQILVTSKTLNSNNFNENTSNEGIQLKNGNRKRVGKYIEAFTNNQILSNPSTITNFIEAKNLNRNNNEIYKPQSIGGFRVTDVDGKTYHYSLPVINFETWYKNYSIANNENDKFYEVESSEPYATDWLLTAVTGPDYVDINNNGTLDESDYGYWVEFDYGKWSDGYIWQSSSGKHDIIKGDVKNGDRYEFHRGRKQIYYLDAVRTRSHTAYFIKSLRKDAQGQKIEHFKNRVSSTTNYDIYRDANVYQSAYYENANPGYRFPEHPSLYNIPGIHGNDRLDMYMGYKKNYSYKDFPQHYSLKLDKIILVKNSSNVLLNKSNGTSLLSNTKAFYAKTTRMFQITNAVYRSNPDPYYSNRINGNHTIGINPVNQIDIHMSSNVLDVNDLNGLNINNNVLKVVNFEYDENYSLMPNSNNSVAINRGKLTLNSIDFLGKNATQHMPKYKFKYNIPSTEFNVSMEDGWGYHKTLPIAWSLNEVTTPTGSKLRFDYESDDFSSVASLSSRIFSKGMSFLLTKNSTTNKLNFVVSRNNATTDNVIEDFNSFLDYFVLGEKISLDFFVCRRSYYGGSSREASLKINGKLGLITSVNSNSVTFEIDNNQAEWYTRNQSEGWILGRIFSLTSVKHSNGNGDSVIMRNAKYGECPDWRGISWPEEYGNDDVNFDYRLASTKTPDKGKSGGIRVRSISTYENDILDSKQNYYYNLPNYNNNPYNVNYKSSGVTSYVPQNYPVIIPYASQLPSPFVMYKNVSVESCGKTNEIISRTDYVFETLDSFATNSNFLYSLGNKLTMRQVQNESPFTNVKLSKFEIKSQLSQIGRLLSVKNYNNKNQLLISKKYNYKVNLDNHGELGVKQESFVSRFKVITSNPSKYNVNAITKIDYPNKLESTESTAGGYTTKTFFEKHDFLTGEVLETKTVTSDGKVIKSRIVPAYTKLPYQQMGSKVDNVNNRNMLTQSAATYSYIQEGAIDKVTGVGITTWNNIWSYQDVGGNISSPTNDKEKIWRKHKTFVWNGVKDNNGIFFNYNQANDEGFDWTIGVGAQPSNWKQTSEITLYDHYSMPLEVKDINSNKAATKMDVLNQKVELSGNAGYNEMYYSGAEEMIHGFWVGQEVRNSNGLRSSNKVHTGRFSIETDNSSQFGVMMFDHRHRGGKYKLSVWVHKDNVSKARVYHTHTNVPYGSTSVVDFNGESYPAGDWVLKTHYFDSFYGHPNYVYVTSLDVTKVIYDDLMIRPIASSITGYVYNEYDELTHIIGNNGLATRFEYDEAGRLIKTYTEIIDDPANNIIGGFKLKSQNRYNYKNF